MRTINFGEDAEACRQTFRDLFNEQNHPTCEVGREHSGKGKAHARFKAALLGYLLS